MDTLSRSVFCAQPKRAALRQHSAEKGRVGNTILIVDDNPDDVFLLGRALGPVIDGCRLLIAYDGAEAQAQLERVRVERETALPDLIFSDINMPRQNGFELLQCLKAHPLYAAVPVIMVSTFDDPGQAEKALALGAIACLGKPPEPIEAQNLARTLLQRAGHLKWHPIWNAGLGKPNEPVAAGIPSPRRACLNQRLEPHKPAMKV